MRMVPAVRLAQAEFARSVASMLSGEGAARYGGRWNHPGTRIVYLAETLSMAALEQLVHLRLRRALEGYRVLRLELPQASVFNLDPADLPKDWRAHGVCDATRTIGDSWVAARASLALRVPSTVIPAEHNILLNPAHPDMASVVLGEIEPIVFDARLESAN